MWSISASRWAVSASQRAIGAASAWRRRRLSLRLDLGQEEVWRLLLCLLLLLLAERKQARMANALIYEMQVVRLR